MTCSEGAPAHRALWIGPAAAEALAGGGLLRVHSVFPSTVNLSVEGAGFLALTGAPGGVHPHAVALERPGDFRSWRLVPWSRDRAEGETLLLHGEGGRVAVALAPAQRPAQRPLPQVGPLGGAYEACLARLQDRGSSFLPAPSGRTPAPLDERLRRGAEDLGAAARAWEPDGTPGPRLRDAVAALVGLGAGLTPAGDDFLCGFLAAVRAAPERAGAGLGGALGEAVAARLDRTGALSAFLLGLALRGGWPGPLVDLAGALARERALEALGALEDLFSIGHSSGADLAAGFLGGLGACAGPAGSSGPFCRIQG